MEQSTMVNDQETTNNRSEEHRPSRRRAGLSFERRFTQAGRDALERVTWEQRQSVITNPDGSVVFRMEGAEVPAQWSQLATDIAVSKYFRKAIWFKIGRKQ